MLLSMLFLGATAAVFLGSLWLVLHAPSCSACKVRLEAIGETVRPWGRWGIDTVFYYICPQCAWTTYRRHIITHLD